VREKNNKKRGKEGIQKGVGYGMFPFEERDVVVSGKEHRLDSRGGVPHGGMT